MEVVSMTESAYTNAFGMKYLLKKHFFIPRDLQATIVFRSGILVHQAAFLRLIRLHSSV